MRISVIVKLALSLVSDLTKAIKSSFKHEQYVIELEVIVDAKGWMQEVTPVLHDHLKAHQFKFERNCNGECRMFYKEWSSDTYWLPDTGLSLLPAGINMHIYLLCIVV